VAGADGGVSVRGLPHVEHGDDVEDREVADRVGVLERQALGDEPAAVVARDGEAIVAEIRA